jgi:hypothetical protein
MINVMMDGVMPSPVHVEILPMEMPFTEMDTLPVKDLNGMILLV